MFIRRLNDDNNFQNIFGIKSFFSDNFHDLLEYFFRYFVFYQALLFI